MNPLAEEAIIYTQGLSKSYQMGTTQVRALHSIDLAISTGEFVALMGASGSGKSTLMHLLGCLDTPSEGKYYLEGREVSELSSDERATVRNTRIGFVFQNFHLLSSLSALENVCLPLLYQNTAGEIEERAAATLEKVGLAGRASHRPLELSGGEQQRVAIARALVTRPAILLADEPTGNLDSVTGIEVMNLLTGLWHEGLTILLVTHDAQVATYARRVLHMRDGQIVREDHNHDLR